MNRIHKKLLLTVMAVCAGAGLFAPTTTRTEQLHPILAFGLGAGAALTLKGLALLSNFCHSRASKYPGATFTLGLGTGVGVGYYLPKEGVLEKTNKKFWELNSWLRSVTGADDPLSGLEPNAHWGSIGAGAAGFASIYVLNYWFNHKCQEPKKDEKKGSG